MVPHRSLLLERARCLGLATPESFEVLAWQRGCRYYPLRGTEVLQEEIAFSNEELAIALMHPSLPWDPQRLRIAAAMTGAVGNNPHRLVRLALQEQALVPLRMVANSKGRRESVTIVSTKDG